MAEAVSTRPTWSVQPDDIVLGFFSFAKFLMYRDLDPENWPAHARLTAQPTIRALLSDGFAPPDGLIPDDASVDEHVAPLDMLHVVDCDRSQTLAVWIGVEIWLIRRLGAGCCHAARTRRALSRSSFARP